MANDIPTVTVTQAQFDAIEQVPLSEVGDAPIVDEVKVEIVDAAKPSFLKDVANGLVNVAKTIWHVPAAQGYIATLIVRLGVPGSIAAVLIPIIDALVK